MKTKRRHLLLWVSMLLSVSMLLGVFGCSPSSVTVTGSGTTAGSGAAKGSGAWVNGSGTAADTGSGSAAAEQEPQEEELNPMPTGDKYIAITFDDGPTGNKDGLTERLLDGLLERNVHATFFLCGYRVKDFNSMMDRYLSEGHEVGNHTMDHVIMTKDVSDGGYQQVKSNNKLIKSYIGQKPTLMRPCGGAYNDLVKQKMKKLGMPMILWNLDTMDWRDRDADTVRDRIINEAQDGSIVLEHDLYETTVDGVLEAIDTLQDEGYAFVTVSELAEIKGVTLKPGRVYTDFTDSTLIDMGVKEAPKKHKKSSGKKNKSKSAQTEETTTSSANTAE